MRARPVQAWLVVGACVCGLIGASDAGAGSDPGWRIEVGLRDGRRHEQATVFVVGRRVRIEQRTPGETSPAHVLIYRGDEDRFLSIDPRARAYVEIDRTLITAAGVPRLAARREVDGRLERLPPSMGAALERLLGIRETGPALAEHPIEVRAVEGTDRVGPLTCRKRLLVRAGAPLAAVCVTAWEEVGIAPRDLDVFRRLANFQRELMGAAELTPLELVPGQSFELLVQFDGFPLYLRGVGGPLRGEIRVTRVEPVAADAVSFGPPAGYAERSAYSILLGSQPASATDRD
jgi:hypothetical protein